MKATIPMAMPIQAPVIDFLILDSLIGVEEGKEVGSVETGGHVCIELPSGREDADETSVLTVVASIEVVGDVVLTKDISELEKGNCVKDKESEVGGCGISVLDSEFGGDGGVDSIDD